MSHMKAAIFIEPGRIVLETKPIPDVGPLDALVRVTTTTICGTDVHILKGEYPVARGLTIGHEPVGVIEKLGSAVQGFKEGQRVIAGAITPSGHSAACLCGYGSQDGGFNSSGFQAMGGWRFGNTIDGCQAEFVLVPDAMANLCPVPDGLTDEQVLMCPDIPPVSRGPRAAASASVTWLRCLPRGRSAYAPPPAPSWPARPRLSGSTASLVGWRCRGGAALM